MNNQTDHNIWDSIGFIMISPHRLKIIEYLYTQSALPSQISSQIKKPIGHVSNLLKGLQERKLVICQNPNLKKGRIYSVTELGRDVYERILKIKEKKE